MDIVYNASPTLSEFHISGAFYRGIMGPVGSGKSTGCCMEIMRRGQEQAPNDEGVRRTRFAVIRNTYRELMDTTVKTWQDWFRPEYFGAVKIGEMSHKISCPGPDGTRSEIEVLFRALDRPDDIKKLLSLEITGAWVNEARETPKGVIDILGDRVGRYPSRREGGCTWRGVIMDTNPPDDDHWWYKLAEEECPRNWAFFRQPGGIIEVGGEFVANPDAENLENLEPDYYITRMGGKSKDYIRVYYCSQYGFVRDGKPVHPEYVDAVHCHPGIISPVPGITLYVGLDFGLTPAATFGQQPANGRWVFIDEIVTEDMGIARFADLLLLPKLNGEYAAFTDLQVWGDPAGDKRVDTDEKTPYQILNAKGIPARPVYTNDPTIRRGAMEAAFTRMVDGKPGLIISPRCKVLRKGLAGGFAYKRVQVSGEERYQNEPVKSKYSHVVEAGEYLLVGAGEGKILTSGPAKPQVQIRVTPAYQGPHSWMGA